MAYDRFLIAPFKTGLQQDLKRFLLPEDAFSQMNNAFVFRGRIKKRFGSFWTGNPAVPNNSRLRIQVGTTDGSGNLSTTLANTFTYAIGQQFTVGTATYTIKASSGALLATVGSGTFDITTRVINLVATGANAGLAVYAYPSQPVMGLSIYENGPINNQPAVAFDMQNPYTYTGSAWKWLNGSGTTPKFTGTNLDYFWTTNWRGAAAQDNILFVTNNVDPIWYWNGSDWTIFEPFINSNLNSIVNALIILPFQGHLIMLNTTEETSLSPYETATYVNRCRFSAYQDPFSIGAWTIYGQPIVAVGTYNPIGGGFVDAATKEAIIGAEFIKDRLIVYFEASTWELAYTANQVLPFRWQKINTELGAVGTFSTVPFDKAVLGIGKTGVHACSGANVERIDQKIPDEVFQFKVKNNAYKRIWGIRVYQPELVVWSFTDADAPSTSNFTDKIMVYNYENQTWSFNDDCITCYGYFEQQSDLLWENATFPWEEASFAWDSNVEPAQLRQVIFGNQQGFVCILEPDVPRNAGNMQVTNMTNVGNIWTFTVINHNLAQDDYILLENAVGITIDPASDGIFKVWSSPDSTPASTANTFIVDTPYLSGTYAGAGTLARVSQIDIISKQWNPYLEKGYGVYLAKIVFAVETTVAGNIMVYYNPDDSNKKFVDDSGPGGTNALIGTSTLDTFPYPGFDTDGSERLWHPVYFQGQGNCVQIRIMLDDAQMLSAASALEEFEVEAIVLNTMSGVIKGL